ncbi:MAG: L,D-transpeptidase family protein [Gammaproteobacteria bacterium]|nr:L,D-transpeptidase family protein [Gammaproteobacteria bacterium]
MNNLAAVPVPGLRVALAFGLLLGLTACQTLPFERDGVRTSVSTDRFVLPSDGDMIGQVQVVVAHQEDTLPEIARRFNLGFDEIVAANPGVNVWMPGEGKRVVLPTEFVLPDAPRKGIVLNLATMRLYYYPEPKAGEPPTVITHPVGIGREGWVTPTGTTKVVKKVEGPSWSPPASIRREHAAQGDPLPARVPPGPDNPLGTHALRLGWPSYLIHGTNKPYGIGMRVTHGCVRLYPEDIVKMYQEVPLGTQVRVVNQPFLVGRRNNQLYLDAHPPLEDDKRDWNKRLHKLVEEASQDVHGGKVDWDKTERVAKGGWGVPVPILVGAPSIEAIVTGAPIVANVAPPNGNYQGRTPSLTASPNGESGLSQLITELIGN